MGEIEEIIAKIREGFDELIALMDSEQETVKCPYCKPDYYIHRNRFKEHLLVHHNIEKDPVFHRHGDLWE